MYAATRKPQPVSTGIVRFVRIVKCPFKKQGAEDVVPCALETWEFRLVLAFDTSCAHCEYHSLLPVALYS